MRPDKRTGPRWQGAGSQQTRRAALAAGSLVDPIPLYRSAEFEALNPDDPRRWQSTVRAADAWYAEGTDEAIRYRLLCELEAAERLADRLCMQRLRQLSYDLSSATDWKALAAAWKPAEEWARLRIYEAPAPRQGQPWMLAELDKASWREEVV